VTRAIVAFALAATALVASLVIGNRAPPDTLVTADSTCLPSTGPTQLTRLFDLEPGGMMAADYQRPIPLPDGRVLWMFQDASVRLPAPGAPPQVPAQPTPPAVTTALLHNAALIQTGDCFELLRSGTPEAPESWLLASNTTPFSHRYWPLDGTIGVDGRLYLFFAEMIERGPLYLSFTEPIATKVAALDPTTLQVEWLGEPYDSSTSLYGFSIANGTNWTYLYAQCHRQFGWSPSRLLDAHDRSCASEVTVGRVPKGRVLDRPQYWDGTSWQSDPDQAEAVLPQTGRGINPSQVRFTGDEFVAVTKEGDWFGSTIYMDRAPAAEGPWTTYVRLPIRPKCEPTTCNTYFASWVPPAVGGGQWVVGLSHNRWDGVVSPINRPTFFEVPAPGRFALAARCSQVDC
jgi:hypothetical protein